MKDAHFIEKVMISHQIPVTSYGLSLDVPPIFPCVHWRNHLFIPPIYFPICFFPSPRFSAHFHRVSHMFSRMFPCFRVSPHHPVSVMRDELHGHQRCQALGQAAGDLGPHAAIAVVMDESWDFTKKDMGYEQ